jgi:16S rRNA (cytosine967-C5)-methyltransferase
VSNVREAAARVLIAIDRGATTLGAELDRARTDIEDARDRALLVEITTGALRWRQQLDALIASASRRSVRQIAPEALAVLRLGAYQLRHLTRVPPHAIINESVEAARGIGARRATGFVNAVLRALVRRGPALSLPARPATGDRGAQLRYLSITLSHPAWLVGRWLDRFGFEATERWCEFNNAPPDLTVRSIGRRPIEELTDRLASEGIEATPSRFVADARRLAPGTWGRLSPDVRDELLVQDEGAQLVGRVVGARPGERVLDTCASPGGKTLVCAADMALRHGERSSLLVAADLRPYRIALLRETILRAGLPVPVVQLDARTPLPFSPVFDRVILDAPCSGLGTLRRDPDLKWSRLESDLARLAADELIMLRHAAAAVRPGGRLVYATCSSEPEENQQVVDGFLAEHPGFSLQPVQVAGAAAPPPVDERGSVATLPFRDGLDAFFAAVLVRQPAA